jgi:hypothetical protein
MSRTERWLRGSLLALLALVLSLLAIVSQASGGARVTRMRAPDGGVQPQAVVDARGVMHMVYLKGEPGASDLFYVRSAPGTERWTTPLRVNSVPGSAIAAGTIRGAHLALGKADRVHVVWNGSGRAVPKSSSGEAPLLYARLNDAGSAFEPQRDLMGSTRLLDGGGTIAADGRGTVVVAWHAADGTSQDERDRRLWVARSRDDGKRFERERPAFTEPTGACPCCAARAFADRRGTIYLLYRTASTQTDRDMYLLVSNDGGARFRGELLHPWKVPT